MSRRTSSRSGVAALLVVIIAGCSASGSTSSAPVATSSPAVETPSASPDPLATPTLEGSFPVAADGRSLFISCWGDGRPTVLLEGGIPYEGLVQFSQFGREFTELLASRTRTCSYDRAGVGSSDPAPEEPRDLDDVTGDLHALLKAAGVEGPIILVGSSGGGMIVTYYASRFPHGVAGVVTLDVPAPSATLSLSEAPELAWDAASNPEHLDIVPEFENRLAAEQFPFHAPLIVVTATGGQSDIEDQSFWLEWSPHATQVELEGGHDIYNSQPQAVAEQVFSLLDE